MAYSDPTRSSRRAARTSVLSLASFSSLVFVLTLLVVSTIHAQSPYSRGVFLNRAFKLEQEQQWQQAADVYLRALRYYPDDNDLKEKWYNAEQVYSLNRRYHDSSFQDRLLKLPESESLDLYREVLAKIQTHYVREVRLRDLAVAGYRAIDMALDRPEFLAINFPDSSAEKIRTLENQIEEAFRSVPEIGSYQQAVYEARRSAQLCRVAGIKNSAAPILEFVNGACESLDPYSSHLSPNRLNELYAMIDGNFVGLGVEVKGDAKGLRLLEVIPESPAEEAGLRPDDIITSIDNASIAHLPPEDAANRLQGPEGTSVTLGIDRQGAAKEIVVSRREIVVRSIRDSRMLDVARGLAYLKIESFQKNTDEELSECLDELARQGMRALVIDLRGNPGGLLDVSLEVANQFIREGTLVSTRGRGWGQNWSHKARPRSVRDVALAVLVDSESASASEIFASAIQDHGRGVVVGSRTYGKGSVQSIFPLSFGKTGLRLTTALFYSPNGKKLQGVGVDPDIDTPRSRNNLGEEAPIPRHPTLEFDAQLAKAVEALSLPLAQRGK